MADSNKRFKEFKVGDQVMIRLRPERFPSGTMKKLHARSAGPFKIIRKFGSNAYEIELPPDLGISPTFNVSDLVEYKEPMLLPSDPFRHDPILKSEPIPDCPLVKTSNRKDRVE